MNVFEDIVTTKFILSRHAQFFFAFLLFALSIHELASQSRPNDTLQVSMALTRAQDQLSKHRFQEAINSAQSALDLSSRLNYRRGSINALLALALAQKGLLNYPASLNFYLQALPEIEKQNNQQQNQLINQKIGELFQEWGVPEKALSYYQSALKFHLKDDETKMFLIEHLAEVYHSLNENNQSLQMYFQLLQISKSSSNNLKTISTLQKIASIYYQTNDLENSLKYNLQILEINRQLNDTINTASSLNIIGNHYKDLNNISKALEYYQKALATNQQAPKNSQRDNRIVTNLINIGVIYQSRGDFRNAIKNFNDALNLKKEKGTPVEIAVMNNYLASLYLLQGDFAEAESRTNDAIALLTGTDNKKMLATNYRRLSDIYAKQGSYEKALESYQTYSLLKDSLLYREQLAQEKEKLKDYLIQTAEREAKLTVIDQEVQSLKLRNEKEIAEREKQEIALLLKEKELQNVSLQKDQSEKERSVQLLQLQQGKLEKEKQEREILLLEQKRDLQNAELQRSDLLEKERGKEIAFKNTKLELQQSQLEQASTRQRNLIYISGLFLALILFAMIGYYVKQRDNRVLKAQFDEINVQKEQIETINKSLVELNEEKNDLIGIVAHDLKSPLNQISGMLTIIKHTAKDQSEEQKGYISQIEQSSNRLKKMVTKILDVSAIEAKTISLTLEKIDITKLLDEIVNRFALMAENKNVRVIKEFENDILPLTTDVGYLSEVLENLMSNAVKYSPIGKQINVRLTKRNEFARIEFIDQGQGISEKEMKFLFGKYRKLSTKPTAGEDSTGLGLSIVKKYAQALNGKVWCESEEGKGSNFIVELPTT
ncbi:MAG: tetratricopeptide repeat protein [Cyclobacteriaceae bacterium]